MERYLVAHKAAGELAYDVAHKLELDGEIIWILSTGGWRIYPFSWVPLTPLIQLPANLPPDALDCFVPSIQVEDRAAAQSLIEALGLTPKREPMRRI